MQYQGLPTLLQQLQENGRNERFYKLALMINAMLAWLETFFRTGSVFPPLLFNSSKHVNFMPKHVYGTMSTKQAFTAAPLIISQGQ